MNEFDLIKKYFSGLDKGNDIALGIGDDCALLNCSSDYYLAISTDTFVEGTHFFKNTDPVAIGHKALAVNLSDLAAMGAIPVGFSLALTLPFYDDIFLKGFSDGLKSLATKFKVPLIGGDTTKGTLSITITVFGKIKKGMEFRRNQANLNDVICVSGPLGGAAYGVQTRYAKTTQTLASVKACRLLDYPNPRLDLVELLQNYNCHCALDISDGLAGDLKHILEASKLNAHINLDKLPIAECLKSLEQEDQMKLALTGGDDYELCFTLSPENYQRLLEDGIEGIYPIGKISNCASLEKVGANGFGQISYFKQGKEVDLSSWQGFTHF